jgi:hypothetical protein
MGGGWGGTPKIDEAEITGNIFDDEYLRRIFRKNRHENLVDIPKSGIVDEAYARENETWNDSRRQNSHLLPSGQFSHGKEPIAYHITINQYTILQSKPTFWQIVGTFIAGALTMRIVSTESKRKPPKR